MFAFFKSYTTVPAESHMPEVLQQPTPIAVIEDTATETPPTYQPVHARTSFGHQSSPSSLSTSPSRTASDGSHSTGVSGSLVLGSSFGGKSRQSSVSHADQGQTSAAVMAEASVQKMKDEFLRTAPTSSALQRTHSAPNEAISTSAMPTAAEAVGSARSAERRSSQPKVESGTTSEKPRKKSRSLRPRKESSKSKRSKKSKSGKSGVFMVCN